ncbi:MAG: hypothetical protein KDK48_01225 [Chlamydiia bacterium]|nr:hypothetical protein [Chlamydiia bacterium]
MPIHFYPYTPQTPLPAADRDERAAKLLKESRKGAELVSAALRHWNYIQICSTKPESALKEVAGTIRNLEALTLNLEEGLKRRAATLTADELKALQADLANYKEQIALFRQKLQEDGVDPLTGALELYFFTRWYQWLLELFFRASEPCSPQVLKEALQAAGKDAKKFYATLSLQYDIVNVPGDGNCGFHALAKVLAPNIDRRGSEILQCILRMQVIEQLSRNQEQYFPFGFHFIDQGTPATIDEYLIYMAQNGNQADEVVMDAMADLLRRPIFVYTYEMCEVNSSGKMIPKDGHLHGKEYLSEAEPLHLYCVNGHYQAMFVRAGRSGE